MITNVCLRHNVNSTSVLKLMEGGMNSIVRKKMGCVCK